MIGMMVRDLGGWWEGTGKLQRESLAKSLSEVTSELTPDRKKLFLSPRSGERAFRVLLATQFGFQSRCNGKPRSDIVQLIFLKRSFRLIVGGRMDYRGPEQKQKDKLGGRVVDQPRVITVGTEKVSGDRTWRTWQRRDGVGGERRSSGISSPPSTGAIGLVVVPFTENRRKNRFWEENQELYFGYKFQMSMRYPLGDFRGAIRATDTDLVSEYIIYI